eukprot:TRINITY_DN759_c0_g2_i3.p3 TRINITY_DN759_c0_g2~~TRINITY_DN759_c0_g2_i3.p3  ORF type:complete len:119 (+),score=54.12 TRINITY_DN759_c0_g2_i3:285-641(+)
MRNWFKQIDRFRTDAPIAATLFLVANKHDLKPVIPRSAADALAAEFHASLYETSTVSGENVREMFVEMTKAVLAEMAAADKRAAATAAAAPTHKSASHTKLKQQAPKSSKGGGGCLLS